MASRSLEVRIDVDRADPENRNFRHNDPIGWTEDNRVEILQALYTILLGNPQLKEPEDAAGKTRFKMWWRMVGSAVEYAAELDRARARLQAAVHRRRRRTTRNAASLADVLEILDKWWPDQKFGASAVASRINDRRTRTTTNRQTVREFLFPGAMVDYAFSSKSVARMLKKHLDDTVRTGERTLVLRCAQDTHTKVLAYRIDEIVAKGGA